MERCGGFTFWKRRVLIPASMLILFSGAALAASPQGAQEAEMKQLTSNIHWLGHDSFRIDGDGVVIYVDPYRLKDGEPKADLILVTHDHKDHASPEDVAMIQKADTVIVTIAAAAAKLAGDIRVVTPGDALTVKGVSIQAVPAYNVNKFRSPGVPFHPKEAGHVGYVFTVNGVRIYHTGDSDFIPEMEGLAPDVGLLPVSGTYVMTAEEAAAAAAAIRPRLAVPMHVGEGIGALSDAERFREMAPLPVVVLAIEK